MKIFPKVFLLQPEIRMSTQKEFNIKAQQVIVPHFPLSWSFDGETNISKQ